VCLPLLRCRPIGYPLVPAHLPVPSTPMSSDPDIIDGGLVLGATQSARLHSTDSPRTLSSELGLQNQ